MMGCGNGEPLIDRENEPKPFVAKSEAERDGNRPIRGTDPTVVIARIIEAYGGNRLEGLNRCRIKYEIAVRVPGTENDPQIPKTAVMEDWFDGPTRMKRIVQRKDNGQNMLVAIINGPQMWVKSQTGPFVERPAPAGAISVPVVASFPVQLMQHQPLGNRISFTRIATSLAEETFKLLIEHDGISETATIVLDSKSYRLKSHSSRKVNAAFFGSRAGSADPQAATITRFSDYRTFHGITLPTRVVVTQNEKVVFRVRVLEFEILKDIPANLFSNPAP